MIRSRNFIATPPGATIKEQLSDRKMNQKEFASRMEMSEKHISRLINGEVQLTPDVAMRLEMVLGLPARFWNNLESIYREKVALATAENEMDEDIVLSKNFPYREMAKNGWVQQTNKTEEKVVNLRKFFEIVKLQLLKEDFIPAIACRRMSVTDKADSALIAWAQKAKIEARNIITEPINISKLSLANPRFPEMMHSMIEMYNVPANLINFEFSENIVFEIEDNGCGIDQKHFETLFTGYYTSENEIADSQKKNAGIGLSVCATIIKAHGGSIEAQNIKTGGAIFRFSLKTEESSDDTK